MTPIMESAFGCLHEGVGAEFDHPPTFVETIIGDGGADNIPCMSFGQIVSEKNLSYTCHMSHAFNLAAV